MEPPGHGSSFISNQKKQQDASLVRPPPKKEAQPRDPSLVDTSEPSLAQSEGEQGFNVRPITQSPFGGGPPLFIPPEEPKVKKASSPRPPAKTSKSKTTVQAPYYEDPPEQARPREYSVIMKVRDLEEPYAYTAPEEKDDYVESSFVFSSEKTTEEDNRSFASPTAKQDAAFTVAKPDREPTSLFRSQGEVNRVNVRTLAQHFNGTGFVEVQQREVTFLKNGNHETELEPGSAISFESLDSTLPMAFDNDRFFDADEGYYHLLKEASDRMRELGANNETFRAPDKEMGFFGWLWRAFVRFFMYLTTSPINRLMFTRGIQESLPFQSAYESFAIGGLIRYFDIDNRRHDAENKRLVFNNRNASRIAVQALGARWAWIYHLNTQVRWSRFFDFLSLFPYLGWLGFPATENFPATRDHAVRGLLRPIFEGSWLTRTITNQQGVISFNRQAPAQNLAAESTGFETGNRNQLGTFFGREESNAFRFEHRLPTDESVVRTFITSPAATMTNNGAEHVLRCLAKHWRNMLFQENGNFAHQRMEQLNPFEILRFHMPITLSLLANLRGRNVWDIRVLGGYIQRLQNLNPTKIKKVAADVEDNNTRLSEVQGPCQAARALVQELKDNVVSNVCGGVPSRIEPFQNWLDAIGDAIEQLSREADHVRDILSSVSLGIKLGYQLLKLVDWYVPPQKELAAIIVNYINGQQDDAKHPEVPSIVVGTALEALAPKDERTLVELIKAGKGSTKAATLLLGRTCTLLVRELRRKALDERIRELSKGPPVAEQSQLEKNKWYWVKVKGRLSVQLFKGIYGNEQKWIDVESQVEQLFHTSEIQVLHYIPVAEAISRAQKAFMVIEIDHGKKFQYNAFMEFGSADKPDSLRTRLRRLAVVAQIFCPELDRARLSVLNEVKGSISRSKQSAKYAASRLIPNCRPQNVTVLGGGPTGLLAAIHCVHNVLLTGGKVKVFESRDAFAKEGSTFERAQIVRLDSRQISMLRYHLGTGFEDVYVPATGETDPHMGNTLPTQGFVEVTIKRLESMILNEAINLRSKGLLHYYSNSEAIYDVKSNTFTKVGKSLREGDRVFDPASPGTPLIMEVSNLLFATQLSRNDLREGKDYDIVLPREVKARKYRLERADVQYDHYHFYPYENGAPEVTGRFGQLPAVFAEGKGRSLPSEIEFDVGGAKKVLPFDEIEKKVFEVDFSTTHVVLATGKPENSPVHIYMTTKEPYAVCCIEGLKISMGMHNFGEKRFGNGFFDDIRSHSDANTRIIGDFTKSVILKKIIVRMQEKILNSDIWQVHFQRLPSKFNEKVPALQKDLQDEIVHLVNTKFRRERLQTRFFELGNNYYLGMEFPREYDLWKVEFSNKVAPPRQGTPTPAAQKTREGYRKAVSHNIDRLWYEACLEIIREGDVYNPSGRAKIPDLYTIDSPFEIKLGELKELDAFRLFTKRYRLQTVKSNGFCLIQNEFDQSSFSIPSKTYVEVTAKTTNRDGVEQLTKRKSELAQIPVGTTFEPIDVFELLKKQGRTSLVRTSRGYITEMENTVSIGRVSDLSRSPDGYSESKVALASFPVAHGVCHRTLRVNTIKGKGGEDGFITAYVGDAQSSPHFMRYSGLTGACINCTTINNLVGQAQSGVSVSDRVQRYAFETTWSNGEVVQRGTGANYGQDGFLRPGFPYAKIIDYLYARAAEHHEIGADGALLSRDWKIKIAAAIVPRGLETDEVFRQALIRELTQVMHQKLSTEVAAAMGTKKLPQSLVVAVDAKMHEVASRWSDFSGGSVIQTSRGGDPSVEKAGALIEAVIFALRQTMDYAVELFSTDSRISSELFHQPKSVDSVVDDFAVEAQNFANALTQSATFAAATVALGLLEDDENDQLSSIFSGLLGAWNILVAFGTMTNVSRYRNRNEEMRKRLALKSYPNILRSVFSLMTPDQRDNASHEDNPFLNRHGVDGAVAKFLADAEYYNQDPTKVEKFKKAYAVFRGSCNHPGAILAFARQVVEEFIAADFHENSYIQEDLVGVYKALIDLLNMRQTSSQTSIADAPKIYQKLSQFEDALKRSTELNPIRFGFLRARPLSQTAIAVTIQYLLGRLLGPTVANRTRGLLRDVVALDRSGAAASSLSRPIRDLTELHYATQESHIGGMLFLSGFVVFCFSILFSVFRVLELILSSAGWVPSAIETVLEVSAVALLGSLLGSLLAFFHFFRKIGHLITLHCRMRPFAAQKQVRTVRLVTKTQIFLTFVRLLAVTFAVVSLPWSVGASLDLFDGSVRTGGSGFVDFVTSNVPAGLAVLSVIAAVLATIFFFIVEFFIRYNLDTCLGFYVCEPFRQRIDEIKATFRKNPSETTLKNDIELERELWEYTAREFLHHYRFDTVFAADRFGTILQHLQSGNKKLE